MLVTRLLPPAAWLGIAAVSAAGLTAGSASAATVCADLGTTPPSLLCSGAVDVAVDDDRDGLTVTVETGATVVPAGDRAMTLGGADQTVINQGTIESTDDEAIRGTGARLTVENSGTIRADEDRAIRLQADADGSRIVNQATGRIFSKDQAIRPDNDDRLADITVENYGLIRAEEGRTIQSRGPGTTVINHGTLDGGEEVVEARDNFRLENYGEIFIGERTRDDGNGGTETFLPEDEDGVQFASGTVDNYGLIRGTDDGIDFDEGTITNHAGAVIQTVGPSGNGIDIDEIFDNGVDADERPNLLAKIDNRGLIEGPQGVGSDSAATNPVTILNSGILRGTLGTAIGLAPLQGDTLVEISGGGQVFGDILFGNGGTNTLVFDGLTDGAGIFSKVAAQDDGTFDVVFRNMTLAEMLAYRLSGDLFELDVATGNSRFRLNAHGANSFELEGITRSSSEFAAYLGANGVAPIPLPAAGWLLLGGMAALGAAARRRR
jgi:hypothetical protein